MSMTATQDKHLANIAKLILWVRQNGYIITQGEAYRTDEQQALHYVARRTKTLHGRHQQRLANDFNFFKGNVYLNSLPVAEAIKAIKPVGDYWKSLDTRNVWGGDWGWDPAHFELDIDKK